MNTEEQLRRSNELFRKLVESLGPENSQINMKNQEEIVELQRLIEEYELEISELKEKLENPENYYRGSGDFDLDNGTVVEEMMRDSIEREKRNISISAQDCIDGQKRNTKNMNTYSSIRRRLKEAVDNMERRLSRSDLAKKKGIVEGVQLSDEEMAQLKEEIEYKKSLIASADRLIMFCAEEIRVYGQIITENNRRMQEVKDKEERLRTIEQQRIIYPKSPMDAYCLLLDKDKLLKLEAGLAALKSRLSSLMYNPSEEIRKQILANESVLNPETKETDPNLDRAIEKIFSPTRNVGNDVQVDPSSVQGNVKLEQLIDTVFSEKGVEVEVPAVEQTNEEDTLGQPGVDTVEDVQSQNEQPAVSSDNQVHPKLQQIIDSVFSNQSDKVEPSVDENPDIQHELEQPEEGIRDDLRAEPDSAEMTSIEDAPDNLKNEKKSKVFIEKWQGWIKQISAAAIELVYDVVDRISKKENDEIPEVEENNEVFKILNSEGEYTLIDLGEQQVFVKYGDTQENAPDGVNIEYIGNEMHIHYPNTKIKSKKK